MALRQPGSKKKAEIVRNRPESGGWLVLLGADRFEHYLGGVVEIVRSFPGSAMVLACGDALRDTLAAAGAALIEWYALDRAIFEIVIGADFPAIDHWIVVGIFETVLQAVVGIDPALNADTRVLCRGMIADHLGEPLAGDFFQQQEVELIADPLAIRVDSQYLNLAVNKVRTWVSTPATGD